MKGLSTEWWEMALAGCECAGTWEATVPARTHIENPWFHDKRKGNLAPWIWYRLLTNRFINLCTPHQGRNHKQTGQLPSSKLLQTRWHSRTSHEKLFLETGLPLSELLLKTTFSHTYVLRHIG